MKLAALAVLVCLTLFASAAEAKPSCAKGDERIGPNCVHTEYAPGPQQMRPVTTVYRIDKKRRKHTLWVGYGLVEKATKTTLTVAEWCAHDETGFMGFWTMEYAWDGKAYTRRMMRGQ